MSSSFLARWGGPAGTLGGALWVLLWAHYLLTHGTGPEDQQGTLLGLTWIDSGKLIVVALALCAVGLAGLYSRHRGRLGGAGTVGFLLALVAMGLVAIGLALSLWPVAWGSYAGLDWQTPLTQLAGIMTALSSVALAAGLALFGIGSLRAGVLPGWIGLLLLVGAATVVPWLHMTVYGGLFGVAWLLIGYGVRSGSGERATRTTGAA